MSFDPYADYGTQVPYALVIDTDSYAGNFEREMCSWITGFEGEYYPGGIENIVKTARDQLGETSDEIIELLGGVNHDEYGHCEVIMTNSPNQKKDYHSVAIMFDCEPSSELLKLMAARSRSFPDAQYENEKTHIEIKHQDIHYDMTKFKKIKILNVRLESFKVVLQKTEVNL